jgi:uncharacterized membrane protein required for colicin V production
MNWIDISIIGFLGITVYIGMKKGLLMSFSNILSMIVAILVAKIYYSKLAIFLVSHTTLEDKIIKILMEKKLFAGFTMGMPKGVAPAFAASQFVENIYYFITMLIINAISILLIYVAARIALAVVEGFLKNTMELPGLKEINGIGGGAIGLIKGVVVLLIVFSILIPMSNIQTWTAIRDGIQTSLLAKFFYSYNFILGWIWDSAFNLIR